MYPSIEPYHYDFLAVSDQHSLYYEQVGHPLFRCCSYIGPGGGYHNQPEIFDPRFFRTVLFDQGQRQGLPTLQSMKTPLPI